jgi:uncharacterized protein
MMLGAAELSPQTSGALWWAAWRLLAVADLHFEKGSAYAVRGTLLPPYDTKATLDALERDIVRLEPQIVICMGDSFHDGGGPARLATPDRHRIGALARGRDWFWIAGNHDPALPPDLPGERVLELAVSPLLFRHEPQAGAAPGELAGHLHPKAAVHVRGRRISRRCFICDGNRAVLPAYGAYTGGLDVFDAAFAALFPDDFAVWLCGPGAVHKLARRRLRGGA